MTSHRHAHFTTFLDGVGYHESAWRQSNAPTGNDPTHFDTLVDAARTAERGLLDAVFFADTPGLEIFRAAAFPQIGFDALELLPALAMRTSRIGLIGSASTTYNTPSDVARRLSTLDHLSRGRAGWNIVTTRWAGAAGSFGLTHHPEHDDRYARAAEFVDAATALWDGWDSDAVVDDKTQGIWADTSKIHSTVYHGQHLQVVGTLPLPRSPQGRPTLAQAGASGPGLELGARVADVIFTAQPTPDAARAFRDRVRTAATGRGRTPDDVLVLPGVAFVLGSTEDEARRRRRDLEDAVDPEFRWRNLAYNAGLDPDRIDPDLPLQGNVAADANRSSRTDDIVRETKATGATFREIAARLTGLPGGLEFTGTPERFADLIGDWITAGACDGFTLQPATLPGDLATFVDDVVPLLQEKGLHRREYTANTLRGHLHDDEDTPC